ncbi:exodeoxyribonuclease V subunit alpha [Pseudidiomarina sediminum]|uniref:exodeoxyribonuclease V subunit alpha n=1 Tax=Pseudidiomarina sediminum TaxID=431675 RepID=UPI001C973CBA|nr:exodeoxyribonuclease V subunit alpha [Pseudidiomarina sediminum]MBY6064411.1 exodeoxyribonuclease V subunit alpha [Pseudidiomarina sediminum]
MQLISILQQWQQQQWIRAIDLSLAEFIVESLGSDHEAVAFLAALTSYQLGRGHPCLELQSLRRDASAYLQLPPEHASFESRQQCSMPAHALALLPDDWQTLLQQSAACEGAASPLVLSAGQRLYLRRYWQYEQDIKADLAARCQAQSAWTGEQLKPTLDKLFGVSATISWQRVACAMAVRSGFTIITGGPGTGKTYTVVRLLATLQELREQEGPLRIHLAAPTGKAAARMTASIGREVGQLPTQYAALLGEAQAVTLHRLLGTQSHTRTFRHHRQRPLLTDVVIVDEASMVDIEMMAALTAALPAHAKLILLGDKDQLASVEAGAVLGQLCEQAEHGHYTPELAQWLAASHGVALPSSMIDAKGAERWPYLQHTVMLHESRRFDAERGIGKLAAEVNHQQTQWLREWLPHSAAFAEADAAMANIAALPVTHNSAPAFRQLVEEGYAPLRDLLQQDVAELEREPWGEAVLQQLERFQLLAAMRKGDWGVERLNQLVTLWLFGDDVAADKWFAGRVVMVTKNDYSVDLRNGDIGLAVQTNANAPLRVLFRGPTGKLRWLLPSRLAHVETAFAMTIHKSQGSEFTHTVVVMPDHDAPILSKELLYTGITRASERLTLVYADSQGVLQAVQRRIERGGGLRDDTN